MPVDLHTHSSASDGSDTPRQLIRRAGTLGLLRIALTDHDTLAGIEEARNEAARVGIDLIPGAELSVEWSPGAMHLVVLWLDDVSGPLQDRLSRIQTVRSQRNQRMVDALQTLGLDISAEEVVEEARGGVVGRPHMAAVLVRKGYAADLQDAFDTYLAKGRPAYVDRERLSPEEAISLAHQSGAVAVLAHPHTLGVENRLEMGAVLDRLVAAGLIGIECHYGTYDRAGRSGMVALAQRFGLLASGGSDYHGSYKPEVALGTGKVGLWIPDAVAESLEAARNEIRSRSHR